MEPEESEEGQGYALQDSLQLCQGVFRSDKEYRAFREKHLHPGRHPMESGLILPSKVTDSRICNKILLSHTFSMHK